MTKCKWYIFFLSDSTTRPSDLPLYVIVESGNSHSVSLKSCFKCPAPSGAVWGEMKIAQTSPIDSHVKSIFFHKTELSMHSLWLPGWLAPSCRVISNGRKSLYERHTASTEAYSVKMAALFSAITRFALLQKLIFSLCTKEDKIKTTQ